jgi:hypothetical protein
MTKSSGAQTYVLSYERRIMRNQLLSLDHNRWQKLDLRLWSRNKATIATVEGPTITNSKKGAAGLEFNKEHAHCFFFSDVNLFLLTLWSTLTFTVTFLDAWEKICNEKDQNFGATTTGSFIMTMRLPMSLKTRVCD